MKTINIYNAKCELLGKAHYVLQDGKYLFTVFAGGIKLSENEAINLNELVRTARNVLQDAYKGDILLAH